jgi:hypothetical protein
MLSFNSLGRMGRLGNQMFQYAALKGIATNHGYEFAIPFSPELNDQDHLLSKYFKLDNNLKMKIVSGQTERWESDFHFDKILFEDCKDNTNINGYFQTEKYFKHIREEILNDFTLKENFTKPLDEYISLHVRRGDYLNLPLHHPVCPIEYYSKAIGMLPDLPIVVVSDDIEWCKKSLNADLYLEGTSSTNDLFVMTQANHNIIANSSFSWWGAWLNKNSDKIVIAPQKWLGVAYHNISTLDLIPEDWISI